MGPELESKGESEVTPEALDCKENEVVSAEKQHLKCESNSWGFSSEIGGLVVEPPVRCRNKDAEINVTSFANSGSNNRLVKSECRQEATNNRLVKSECQEATDNSSSFDGTDSDIENSADVSDTEVISGFHGDGSSALELNGFVDIFRLRKKKLTPHWRTFIRPLMWRCKWVELQIKKFDMQARKYHRELAEYNQRKHFLSENETCMKSFPLPDNSPRDEVLRRKKRKRTEETTDVVSYISHHNLFSYYEKRNPTANGTRVDEDWASQDKLNGNDESEANDEGFLLESRGGDNSAEEIFRKIGKLQSQVGNLKSRLDKVKRENPGNLSLVDDLCLPVPSNGLTSSTRSVGSPPNHGDGMPVGSSNIASELISQYNRGKVVVPESAISGHGEVSYITDMIECTNQSLVSRASTNTEDDVLIYNERMKEEMNNLDEISIERTKKPQVTDAYKESTFPAVHVKQELLTDVQPAPKMRSISKLTAPKSKKKKRGKRKPIR